jgi:signal peptidase I
MAEVAYRKSTAREYFESLVITVILALFGTTFIVQAFKIPTPSMEDNLLVGDHLLVNKFVFGAQGSFLDPVLPFKDIERGNVIVFKYPKDLSKHYVKRAIGLPGDRLKIVDRQIYINGEPLDEPYKVHKRAPAGFGDPINDYFPPKTHPESHRIRMMRSPSDEDPFWYEDYTKDAEIIVPPGHYFAMGDNRDNSADSRYWGFVPREFIVGKGLIIYWSYETDSDEYRRTDVGDRIQQVVDLVTNFFTKTRWSRTFKIIR